MFFDFVSCFSIQYPRQNCPFLYENCVHAYGLSIMIFLLTTIYCEFLTQECNCSLLLKRETKTSTSTFFHLRLTCTHCWYFPISTSTQHYFYFFVPQRNYCNCEKNQFSNFCEIFTTLNPFWLDNFRVISRKPLILEPQNKSIRQIWPSKNGGNYFQVLYFNGKFHFN